MGAAPDLFLFQRARTPRHFDSAFPGKRRRLEAPLEEMAIGRTSGTERLATARSGSSASHRRRHGHRRRRPPRVPAPNGKRGGAGLAPWPIGRLAVSALRYFGVLRIRFAVFAFATRASRAHKLSAPRSKHGCCCVFLFPGVPTRTIVAAFQKYVVRLPLAVRTSLNVVPFLHMGTLSSDDGTGRNTHVAA